MRDEIKFWGEILGGAAVLICLVTIVVALVAGLVFGIRWVTAGPSGKLQAREQILSGDNRIQAYGHFFDLCAAVQTDEASLEAQYDLLKVSKGDDRERIVTNIGALLADRAGAVNQYNQDAQKSYTIGQFKSSKLPWQLSDTFHRGRHTVCAA